MSRLTQLLTGAFAAAAVARSSPVDHANSLIGTDWSMASYPRTFTLNGRRLLSAKAALAVGEPSTTKALESLLTDAKDWLDVGPWSVTAKNDTGPTDDKHNYVDQMGYFWPNPDTEDGCPYVPKDGLSNPDSARFTDSDYIKRVFESSYDLALAWYYTEDPAYAEHAALILRTWFLDPDTKMNPNMNYAAWLPCLSFEDNPYTSFSLIPFSSRISFVIDAIRILETTGAPGWTAKDTDDMHDWVKEMLSWLTDSSVGSSQLGSFNNHGVYAHLAGINMAMYTGDTAYARALLKNVTLRIDDGISANGSQPHELIRTQPFHYSMFTMVGFARMALMGEKLCFDLWEHTGPEGQSIQKGIEFLIPPAINGTDVWPYPEEIHFERAAPHDLFHYAAEKGSTMALDALTNCRMERPSLGDRWPIRPAPQELEATSITRPKDP